MSVNSEYMYIYTNLQTNAIVRLPHPRSGDSQCEETFLAPSADKQIRNYDTELFDKLFDAEKLFLRCK